MERVDQESHFIRTPDCLNWLHLQSIDNFKQMVKNIANDAQHSKIVAKSYFKTLKLLAESTENNVKMFNDLRKGEIKNYQKAKDGFVAKIKRFYETRHQIHVQENKIEEEEQILAQNDLNESEHKKLTKSLADIKFALAKTKIEFSQMKIDAVNITQDFNGVKHKFVRLFNAYSENVENRIKDNIGFFIHKMGDLVNKTKLNNPEYKSSEMLDSEESSNILDYSQSIASLIKAEKIATVSNKFNIVIESLLFEPEAITDPDYYMKFKAVLPYYPSILKEIDSLGSKIKPSLITIIQRTASDVILKRKLISDLISIGKESLEAAAYCNRVAMLSCMLEAQFGRVSNRENAAKLRDLLLASLNSTLMLVRLSWKTRPNSRF